MNRKYRMIFICLSFIVAATKSADNRYLHLVDENAWNVVLQYLDYYRKICGLTKNPNDLDLSGHDIEFFPQEGELSADLWRLKLSNNLIKKIPRNLNNYQNLFVLEINNNRLEDIPDNLPESLEFLKLNNNKIKTIPNGPSQLTTLELNGNRLTSITGNVVFEHLNSLKAAGNNITTVNIDQLRKCYPHLNELDLSQNLLDEGTIQELQTYATEVSEDLFPFKFKLTLGEQQEGHNTKSARK